MECSLIVLGSGTSVPTPDRRPPAFLLKADALSLLVDCGAGCTTGLAAAGVTLETLSAVLISHLHLDHTGGVPALLFTLRNPLGPRREDDLVFYGPAGFSMMLDGLDGVYGKWLTPLHCARRCKAVSDRETFEIGPARIEAFRVAHTGSSFAYRVQLGERAICFSGDSGPCEGLTAAAAGVDLFVCECGAAEDDDFKGHMSASDVGETAAEAGCKAVLLTHLYPHIVVTDPVSVVKERYSGTVTLAEDGMRIEV